MQDIEPHYNWRHIYISEDDAHSPFFGREYSEFEYSNTVYNYYIHPQWDDFGSRTLYCKIIFADYDMQVAIIELIGEWNDAIENDIMTLKYELLDPMHKKGIIHFIFIAENVLNFHSNGKDYYEALFEELNDEGGWAVMLNLSEPAQYEYKLGKLHNYIELMQIHEWRVYKPHHLFKKIESIIDQRLDFK